LEAENFQGYHWMVKLAVLLLGALGTMTITACTKTATQLLVVVDSDLPVPQLLTIVKVEVRTLEGERLTGAKFQLAPSTQSDSNRVFRLPISFATLPPESSSIEQVVIEVGAVLTSTKGIENLSFVRRAITRFVEGKSLILPMFLASQCLQRQCAAGLTCTESGCENETIDAMSLNESTRTDEDLVIPGSGKDPVDAGHTPDADQHIEDSGRVLDAGERPDSGGVRDADEVPDSGGVRDADEVPDSGVKPDVGFFPDGGSIFVQTSSAPITWVYSGPANIYLMQNEVTTQQYELCVLAGVCASHNFDTFTNNGCNYGDTNRSDHPMNCVDWDGANAFCMWVGGRLPERDEWYAEASNMDSRLFPWGNSPSANCDYCVMNESSAGGPGCGLNSTGPSCSMPMGHSISGLCDLSGNTREWTSSISGQSQTTVGGSWIESNSADHFASVQANLNRSGRNGGLGFRCVTETAIIRRIDAGFSSDLGFSAEHDSGLTSD
jgi:formylglycine-generating enzyme